MNKGSEARGKNWRGSEGLTQDLVGHVKEYELYYNKIYFIFSEKPRV